MGDQRGLQVAALRAERAGDLLVGLPLGQLGGVGAGQQLGDGAAQVGG
ncbi:MAG: hypothetical protein L0Y54_00610 [Sporichthyaceae bacterium]|nr:hypothetical protein [Sporichthyaceae bacterium]